MSFAENNYTDHQNQLRIEALEKELQRLRNVSQNQSSKIGRLRKSNFIQAVFFISLFAILLVKGFIMWPGHAPTTQPEQLSAATLSLKSDSVQPVEQKDTVSSIIYNTHKGALPKKDFDGIIFAVQIGAYTGLDISKYENNLLGLKQDSFEGINQFTLGEFTEFEEAEQFLEIVKQLGMQQAFIMSFKDGRRIHIQSALAEKQGKRPAKIIDANDATETNQTAEVSSSNTKKTSTSLGVIGM